MRVVMGTRTMRTAVVNAVDNDMIELKDETENGGEDSPKAVSIAVD